MTEELADPAGFLTVAPGLKMLASDPNVAAAIASGDVGRLRIQLNHKKRFDGGAGTAVLVDELLARLPKPKRQMGPVYAFGILGLFLIGLIVAVAVYSAGRNDLYLLNGLDFPVEAMVEEHRITVPAEGREVLEVATGPQPILVRAGDRILAEEEVEVPAWTDFVAYNVLGAAPVYLEGIEYTERQEEREGFFAMLAGRTFVKRADVDFLFRDAPEEIQVSDRNPDSIHTRWLVNQLDGGWRSSVRLLAEDQKHGRAAKVAAAVARLTPAELDAVERAVYHTMRADGIEPALKLAEELAARVPHLVSVQELHQSYLMAAGQTTLARERARARLAADSDNLDAVYLLADVAESREAEKLLVELIAANPKDYGALVVLGTLFLTTGRYGAALGPLDAALAEFPDDVDLLTWKAQALVGVGRVERAAKLVAEAAQQIENPENELAILYAKLARLVSPKHQPAPEPLIARTVALWDEPIAGRAFIGAVLGDEGMVVPNLPQVADADTAAIVELTYALHRDADRAVELALAADVRGFELLLPESRFLLACELWRRGERKTADLLFSISLDTSIVKPTALAFLAGDPAPDGIHQLEVEWLAAMTLVRGRVLAAAGESAQKLTKRAEELDLLGGVVTHAARNWRPPKK